MLNGPIFDMNRITKIALEYFRPPDHHFWRWAENGEVLEWQNGTTICYREDLIPILKSLAPDGLPPLGTILLVLAACQDGWKDAYDEKSLLDTLVQYIKTKEDADLDDFLVFGIQFLDLVNAVSKDLRTGAARVRLLHEVAACMPHKIISQQARELIHEFDTGKLDEMTVLVADGSNRKLFVSNLENLQQAFGVFTDVAALELAIRTGLLQEPKPASLDWEDAPLDLLEELAKNRKTKGFSNLTRRIIAAINIPMQTIGSGDLPLGGVSDITNRGDFDRLLLSELAHDDLSLTVRLVNNEALYLRREEPPSKLIRQRTILVDTSIKMWGVPRVFATSAALACAQNNKYDVPLQAFAMGGKGFLPIDLSTKNGVIETLEILDGALHCGPALEQFFTDHAVGEDEYIFITEENQLTDAGFLAYFNDIKQKINFLITVDRAGDLHFFQMIAGRKKRLSKSKFDLNELLFPSQQQRGLETLEGVPKFMEQHPAPLLFPAARVLLSTKRYCFLPKIGCLAVSELQHLLFWPESRTGASELLGFVEPGRCYFGQDGSALAFILVLTPKNKVILYEFDVHNESIMQRFVQPLQNLKISQIAFQGSCFYIQTNQGVYVLDCDQEEIQLEGKKDMRDQDVFQQYLDDTTALSKKEIKKFINNGYSVLQHVNRIYINEEGLLCLDSRAFQFVGHNASLSLSPVASTKEKGPAAIFNYKKFTLTDNKHLQFRRAVWENGSEALIDPRGFLHLRSANPSVPELTLVLVLDRNTACWSSDGKICGSLYFTARSTSSGELAKSFYQQYIQAFIDSLG